MVPNYQPRTFSKESADVMSAVCKNTLDRLKAEAGIDIQEPEVAFTVSTVFMEEALRYLAEKAHHNNGEAKVEIYKLMTLGVDLRESDTAEKDGNFTVIMVPGPAAKEIVKDDGSTESK